MVLILSNKLNDCIPDWTFESEIPSNRVHRLFVLKYSTTLGRRNICPRWGWGCGGGEGDGLTCDFKVVPEANLGTFL